MPVTELRCAQCGAALPESAAHRATVCTFCGATSTPAPRVVERVVERIVVANAPAGSDAQALHCPRCAVALRERSVKDLSVVYCPDCGGAFVRREDVGRLPKKNDAELDAVAFQIRPEGMKRLFRADLAPSIGCPICRAPLRREEIRFSRVQVDVCDAHGIWFDWGEMKTWARPPTDDPSQELTEEELAAAGLHARSNEDDGFFTSLRRLLFGD